MESVPTPTTPVYPSVAGGADLEIEPAALIGAAGTMDAEAQAIAQVVKTLQTRLIAVGACWGNDVVGERFGADYQPVAAQVLENLGAMSVGLVRIAAALRAVAQQYDALDTNIGGAAQAGAIEIDRAATSAGGSHGGTR